MLIFAVMLLVLPFLSVPPFIFSSYVQPLPLLLGWLIILSRYRLSFDRKLFGVFSLYLLYIVILRVLRSELLISGTDLSVLVAYIFGIFSFGFFLSLFRHSIYLLTHGSTSLYRSILRALSFSLCIVPVSLFLQLLPGLGQVFSYFKPRSVFLDGRGLSSSLRGLSGILPEPSYVGGCSAVLFVALCSLSFAQFIQSYPAFSLAYKSASSLYREHSLDFFYRYWPLLALNLLAIALTFSPASTIVFVGLLSVLFLPLLSRVLQGYLSARILPLLCLLLLLLIAFLLVSSFFPSSRAVSLVQTLADLDISGLLSADLSFADRYASSVTGLLSIFIHPFGLGLNGHAFIFSDCNNDFISSMDLLCGSIYSSDRNHNASANFAIDGGLVSVFLFFYVASLSNRCDIRNSLLLRQFAFVRFLSSCSVVLLLVVLPAPLGSPFLWLPLSALLATFDSSAILSILESRKILENPGLQRHNVDRKLGLR